MEHETSILKILDDSDDDSLITVDTLKPNDEKMGEEKENQSDGKKGFNIEY